MNRWPLTLAAVLTLTPAFAQQQSPKPGVEPEVVYGEDDRLDLYQITNRRVLQLADSTVGLFRDGDITVATEGDAQIARLATQSYAETYSLCKEEPFYDQRTGAFCSGSLVAPDIIMTAGHCVRSELSCQSTKFVFGFSIRQAGTLPESVPASDVFGCKELIGSVIENSGPDWALVRLDRAASDHKPLEVNRTGTLAKGTPLFVIGHPAGLPTKVAGGATVRDPDPNGYFVANLDTYGGNSGSAVFNAQTGLVEGILVRGETDYTWNGSCRVSNRCPDDGCRGEDVTKVSAPLEHLPGPAALAAGRMRIQKPGEALSALLGLVAPDRTVRTQ